MNIGDQYYHDHDSWRLSDLLHYDDDNSTFFRLKEKLMIYMRTVDKMKVMVITGSQQS